MRSLLYVALDAKYITDQEFSRLIDLANEAGRIIGGLRTAVQRQRDEERRKP